MIRPTPVGLCHFSSLILTKLFSPGRFLFSVLFSGILLSSHLTNAQAETKKNQPSSNQSSSATDESLEEAIPCQDGAAPAREPSETVFVKNNEIVGTAFGSKVPLPEVSEGEYTFDLRRCVLSPERIHLLFQNRRNEEFRFLGPPRITKILSCERKAPIHCSEEIRLESKKPGEGGPLADLPLQMKGQLLTVGKPDDFVLSLRSNDGLSIDFSDLFDCFEVTRKKKKSILEQRTLGKSCPENPTQWWKDMQTQFHKLQERVPPRMRRLLQETKIDFLLTGFDPFLDPNRPLPSFAEGDFNCDGSPDYAFVGVTRQSALGKILTSAKPPSQTEITAAMGESKSYSQDRPAQVLVALSSGTSFLWEKTRGSSVRNAGSDCGCCNSSSKEREEMISKEGCSYLYIGCCEVDGSFLIYTKGSTRVRFGDGC